jgi:pimeloyl-ACP methyl ester carboxylesterase
VEGEVRILRKKLKILVKRLNIAKKISNAYCLKGFVVSSNNAVGLINYVYDNKHDLEETKVKYEADLKKNSPFTVMDGYIDFYLQDNRIGTDSLEQIPLKSDVPSLFLVGTYDPITPVSWTEFTASGFPNKFYFKFPRIGHVVSNSADSDCGWSM